MPDHRPRRRAGICVWLIAFSGLLSLVSLKGFGQTYDNLVLAKLGTGEILRYLDASDHAKSLTDGQIATKYILGDIPEGRDPPVRALLEWKSLPLSEQRQLKVIWFREHYQQLSVEEVNKYVNVGYLMTRAVDEFRENPLAEQAERDKATAKTADKRPKKVIKKPGKTSTASDTGAIRIKKPVTQKKSDSKTPDSSKPKSTVPTPPLTAAVKTGADKSDTAAKNGSPDKVIRKLPWYGIPNKMKNE